VLTNFDVFADAGGANKADVKQFLATADSNGRLTISFTTIKDNAKVSAIEILPSTTTLVSAIHAGGGAAGSFVADTGFSGGSTYTTSAAINLSGVTSPAPQSVYQTERYGNFTYTVANLTAGASYIVRLRLATV